MLLTVLVDEHANRDAAHVEAVQKVLDILVGYWVVGESLFVFYDTLGHSRHYIVVPVSDGNQGINKTGEEGYKDIKTSVTAHIVSKIEKKM